MRKTLFFLIFLCCLKSFGQNLVIDETTPWVTCAGNQINVNFTPSSGVSGPYTVELIEEEINFYYTNVCPNPPIVPTVTRDIAFATTSNNTAILTVPTGISSSYTYLSSGSCSGYRLMRYYLRVRNSSLISEKYLIDISSTVCTNRIMAVKSSASYCSPSSNAIYLVHNGLNPDNVFTFELSDENSSFANPITLATLASNTATSAIVPVPSGLVSGEYYALKVKSSSPVSEIIRYNTMIGIPEITIRQYEVCNSSVIRLEVSGFSNTLTYAWYKDGNLVANESSDSHIFLKTNATQSDIGQYQVRVTNPTGGCTAISASFTPSYSAVPVAPTVSASPSTVVSGNSSTITATGCSGGYPTFYIYKSLTDADGPIFGSNTSSGTFTISDITQNVTYYISCNTNIDNNYCRSSRTPVTITVNATNAPAPPSIISASNNVCTNDYGVFYTLTATGCSGGIVKWYNADNQLLQTNTAAPYTYLEYTTQASKTTYADCRVNGVLSTTKSSFVFNKFTPPAQPVLPRSIWIINAGSSISITASQCDGGVYKWYDATINGNLLYTGQTYMANNVQIPTDYYVSCSKVANCESTRTNAHIEVSATLTEPLELANPVQICGNNAATIVTTGCSNGTVNWYDQNSGGSLLGTGQSFQTPNYVYNINGGQNTYLYYADCTIGGNTSPRKEMSVIVEEPVDNTAITANSPTIACNSKTTLLVTGCYASAFWYESLTAQNYIGTGTTFTTPNLSSTTIYYVDCVKQRCSSGRIPVTVNASCTPPNPPVISSNISSVCAGGSVNLTATGCAGIVNWSDGGTGTSRSDIVFNTSINLTATCTVSTLVSTSSNVIVLTVNPNPSLIINNPAVVAPPSTVDITVASITTGSILPIGTILSYYTDMTGNTTLPNPNSINTSGTYYIKALSTAGCADIKPVIVTINECANIINLVSPIDDYSSGTQLRKTGEIIIASNKVSSTAKVTYRSNKSITLTPGTNAGFSAIPTTGGFFKAEISGCN